MKAPTTLKLDASQGVCEAKYVPVAPTAYLTAFADTGARAGVEAFFKTVGRPYIGSWVAGKLADGTFFEEATKLSPTPTRSSRRSPLGATGRSTRS